MAVIKAAHSGASLKRIINYVTQAKKTEEHLLAGINCDPQNAYDDMMLVKEIYGKKNGRQYKHFIYSFPPGEDISPKQVLENAQHLAEETPALKGCQMLIAVHKDREHLHAHIIVNSVNAKTGYKLQWAKSDLSDLKERCNALSKAQGLSIPQKGQSVTAWTMPKQQALAKAMAGQYQSYYLAMADAISDCQSQAVDQADFVDKMAQKGIQVNWTTRKHITFVDAEGHKVRDSNFAKTLKIACSKDALQATFAKNAENLSILHRLKNEEDARAKTTNLSLLHSFAQPLKEKWSTWRQERQEATAQEAMDIAMVTALDSKRKRETAHEISATANAARRVAPPRSDRQAESESCNTEKGNREVAKREKTAEAGIVRSQVQPEHHQQRHYLAKKRQRTEKERSQGMGR